MEQKETGIERILRQYKEGRIPLISLVWSLAQAEASKMEETLPDGLEWKLETVEIPVLQVKETGK